MSEILNQVLAANRAYAKSFGNKKDLPSAPARRCAILTCMDARLDPAKFAGLEEGDAHVVRNAGGRASDDAIRSLVISYKLLGTREWFVVHHTDCGMESVTNEIMRGLLEKSLEPAKFEGGMWRDTGRGPGSQEGGCIEWLTIKDRQQSVREDVERLHSHPLVPGYISIYGYIYNVSNGRLEQVPGARRLGPPERSSTAA